MFRHLIRTSSILLLSLSLLMFPATFSTIQWENPRVKENIQSEIDSLLKDYDTELKNELANGTTQIDPSDGITRVLVGESQAKMDRHWVDTVAKINALQARPESERSHTEDLLTQISGTDPAYISLAGTPYDPSAELEEYEAGNSIYQVDIKSGHIVKIWITDQNDYSLEANLSEEELIDISRNFVFKVLPGAPLDYLNLTIENKDAEVYFFRWQDFVSQTVDGTRSFIQVALSRSGDFLNFENTFPFSQDSPGNIVSEFLTLESAFAIGANEFYSNGGTRWGWEIHTAAHLTQNNAGYCYGQGSWCTPKNFFHTPSPSGNNTYDGTKHRGKWTATTYMRNRSTKTSAWIPCTHATAAVFYYNWYNGGSSHTENGVNQQIWCNTWVVTSNLLYDIQRVVLANTSETCCNKEIAWDEIWDYVP
jgi:hypothetical protein